MAHAVQNLDMYLINEGKSWYLTDAGGFNSWLDPHADRIVQAVHEAIPAGQSLKYVIRKPQSPPSSRPRCLQCTVCRMSKLENAKLTVKAVCSA